MLTLNYRNLSDTSLIENLIEHPLNRDFNSSELFENESLSSLASPAKSAGQNDVNNSSSPTTMSYKDDSSNTTLSMHKFLTNASDPLVNVLIQEESGGGDKEFNANINYSTTISEKPAGKNNSQNDSYLKKEDYIKDAIQGEIYQYTPEQKQKQTGNLRGSIYRSPSVDKSVPFPVKQKRAVFDTTEDFADVKDLTTESSLNISGAILNTYESKTETESSTVYLLHMINAPEAPNIQNQQIIDDSTEVNLKEEATSLEDKREEEQGQLNDQVNSDIARHEPVTKITYSSATMEEEKEQQEIYRQGKDKSQMDAEAKEFVREEEKEQEQEEAFANVADAESVDVDIELEQARLEQAMLEVERAHLEAESIRLERQKEIDSLRARKEELLQKQKKHNANVKGPIGKRSNSRDRIADLVDTVDTVEHKNPAHFRAGEQGR